MAIIATQGDKRARFNIPAGLNQAVCFGVWDIGRHFVQLQHGSVPRHQVVISWETSELIPSGDFHGKRMIISKKYTLSVFPKATLCTHVEGWLGRGLTEDEKESFDVEKLIGQNCTLNIVQKEVNGNTYDNVASISPLMKGMIKLVPENSAAAPKWVAKLVSEALTDEQVERWRIEEEAKKATGEDGIPF